MVYHPAPPMRESFSPTRCDTLAAAVLGCGTALGLTLGACAGAPPEVPDLAFHRGQNALALGRYDWARHYFEEDLRAHPERSESLRGLGLAWISGYEGSLTRGIETLADYLERVPGDTEIRLHLARSWLRLGESEQAFAILGEAGDSAQASELRARALADADPAAAERLVTAALAIEPGAVDALLLAARLAHRRGDAEVALARAQTATRADPLRDEAFYLLASIRRGLGDQAGAARDLETYRQLRLLPARGRPSKLSAFEERQVMRDLEPWIESSALPWRRRRARVLLKTGDPEAEAATEELIAGGAGDAGARLEAVDVLELAGEAHKRARVSLARDLYLRALELDPELRAARAQLARLEHEAGDRQAAGRLLAAGLAADPYHAPYHFVSGLLALGRGQERRATEAFTTALDLAPWLASYRLALADVYLAAGRRDDLERLLEQAPAEDPAIAAYRRRHL